MDGTYAETETEIDAATLRAARAKVGFIVGVSENQSISKVVNKQARN